MNAYELAEIMTTHDGSQVWEHGLEIANMLRQQADRIAELEKQSEPVAWMYQNASGEMKMLGNTRLEEWVTKFRCKEIPLYTKPQTKPLSDEEINQIIKQQDWFSMTWIDMVRRIERIIKEKNEPTNR